MRNEDEPWDLAERTQEPLGVDEQGRGVVRETVSVSLGALQEEREERLTRVFTRVFTRVLVGGLLLLLWWIV